MQWTWTVISQKELELDEEEKGKRQPEWVFIVDKPFSKQMVIDTIEKWLRDRHYNFTVRLLEPEQAEGSGMYTLTLHKKPIMRHVGDDQDRATGHA